MTLMRRHHSLAILVAVVGLAACAASPPEKDTPVRPARSLTVCGADHLADKIGLPFVAEGQTPPADGAFLTPADLPPAYRVVPFGHRMTMDFRPDRLTVLLDAQGRISALRCG